MSRTVPLSARRRVAAMCAMLAGLNIIGGIAQADVFVLNNDGRVQGELLNPDEQPRQTFIVKTQSGGQIALDKAQVKQVIAQSADELQYEKIRYTHADTVEAQWKLAEWCREQGLFSQRATHLKRIVELDPNHKQARAGLGFGQIEGRWVRQEDLMKERGYVMYKGSWLLPQDVEIQESKRKAELAEKEWFTKLKRLRGQMSTRGPKAELALAEFKAIKDPTAVAALAYDFQNESSDSVKEMYLAVLAQIPSGDAVRLLVNISLEAGNEELRLTALDHLKREKRGEAVPHYVTALKSKENYRINRAGIALGDMNDKSAIGPLIEVLVTVHKEKVQKGGGAGSISPSFDSNGGIGFGAGGGGAVIIKNNVANRGVLEALVKLSDGKDFGFDVQAWKYWYAAQKKTAPNAGRRD